MQSEIKRWGNSAAVRIPKKLLHEARLDINTPVTLEVMENKLVIEARKGSTPKRLKLPFREALAMVLEGKITDGLSIMGILKVARIKGW